MPSPYVVNLVGPDVRTEGKSGTEAVSPTQGPPVTKKEEKTAAVGMTGTAKTKTVNKTDEKHVSEQIAALEAKKRIKKLTELRNNVISVKGSGQGKPGVSHSSAGKSGGSSAGKGGSSSPEDYSAKITNDIQQNWDLPSAMSDKNLEAIISIKILRDGTLFVNRIEKSSGNGLFDRSALRAIAKSSPVTPPPYEMEIGVRFYP